jgi:hypothetical protein
MYYVYMHIYYYIVRFISLYQILHKILILQNHLSCVYYTAYDIHYIKYNKRYDLSHIFVTIELNIFIYIVKLTHRYVT